MIDMAVTYGTRQLLSVAEISELLTPVLERHEVAEAYLCGPYVRADKNGDIRRSDELSIVVVAEDIPVSPQDRYESFRDLNQTALSEGVLLTVHVYSKEEAERAGSSEQIVRWLADDWEKIL